MRRSSLFLIIIGGLVLLSITCTLVGGSSSTPAPDSAGVQSTLDALQNTVTAMEQNGEATADAWMTQVAATGQPVDLSPQVPTEELLPGSVSGKLSYPSEMIPPLRLVLWNTEDGAYLTKEIPQNTAEYEWDGIAPGHYQMVAYLRDGDPGAISGGYSQAVPCGLAVDCTDHSLIVFEVRSGETTTNIDPGDWYAPAGSFPSDPTR
ncbi:MAG TPA: hypothetical protein VIO36_01695 [Anaerolineaceae bacterium]